MQATGLSGFILQASRSAQVAEFLRDSILSGKLKPGDRVVERTLAKSLGVGQTTVREALQVLEHEGLIYKKANTASFVTQFSPELITEIVEIRTELEPKAFALAHRKKTAELLDDLQRLVNNIEEGAAKHDYYHVLRNDLRFHEMVWRAAGNQTLEQILLAALYSLVCFSHGYFEYQQQPTRGARDISPTSRGCLEGFG